MGKTVLVTTHETIYLCSRIRPKLKAEAAKRATIEYLVYNEVGHIYCLVMVIRVLVSARVRVRV